MGFDLEKYYKQKEDKIIEILVKKWEIIDYHLFKNKRKKYKVDKIKERKLITKFGVIKYKRRIYFYYNKKLNKIEYVSLLDRYLKIPKYKRFSQDVINHITQFLGDGKRYRDIQDTLNNINISLMTISRIFKNYKLNTEIKEKIKVKNNERIYINLDDCYLNFNRKQKINYQFRLISFNTGKTKNSNNRNVLKNKRIALLETPVGTKISEEKYITFIWKKLNQFYEFDNLKITVGGDGAFWIKNAAKWFGANYVFDRFHALRYLWAAYKPNIGKRKLKLIRENFINYQKAKEYFIKGQYDELINFLEVTKIDSQTLSVFKKNKDGVFNQKENWNIEVSAESDVFHFIKSLKGNGSKIYNEKTYINMVNYKIAKFNNVLL